LAPLESSTATSVALGLVPYSGARVRALQTSDQVISLQMAIRCN